MYARLILVEYKARTGVKLGLTNLTIFNFFLLTAAKVMVTKFGYFQFFPGATVYTGQLALQPSDRKLCATFRPVVMERYHGDNRSSSPGK